MILGFEKGVSYVWSKKDMTRREAKREEYKKYGKGYYHMSSDGWKDGVIFHGPLDFAYGMILMGLLALKFDIVIYEFTLMANHVHILMSGTGKECLKAFDYLFRQLNKMQRRGGHPTLPEDYWFRLTPVATPQQMAVNFLYIARNPFEKQLCVPNGYPWGSASCRYSMSNLEQESVRAGSLSKRELINMTHSRENIPDDWYFHPQYGLLPSCFVNNEMFYKLFPTPKDYAIRLVKDYEAFVKLGKTIGESVDFSQAEKMDIVRAAIHMIFPRKQLGTLTQEETARICVRLEKDYGFCAEELSQIFHLPLSLLAQFSRAKEYN